MPQTEGLGNRALNFNCRIGALDSLAKGAALLLAGGGYSVRFKGERFHQNGTRYVGSSRLMVIVGLSSKIPSDHRAGKHLD